VNLARRFWLPVCARSGGHGYGGWSSVNNGLIVDVTLMNSLAAGNFGIATSFTGRPAGWPRALRFSIILIGNIDYIRRTGQAGCMTFHRSVKRRYVDLLLVASAVCRHRGPAAPPRVG